MELDPLHYQPIGLFRTAEVDKAEVARQGVVAHGEGYIELANRTGYAHALHDLHSWERIWIVFHFHRAGGFRPKVWPPRSAGKRGVLATRSPHRPNAIGLTAARLLGVDGLRVRVAEVDLLDQTPVLDIKPYVPYADAFPAANNGWLDGGEPRADATAGPAPRDPLADWTVHYTQHAREALSWLLARGEDLEARLTQALALGPTPQPYRRIKVRGDGLRLALKEWRADFRVLQAERTLVVHALCSGYREGQLASDPTLTTHRDFEHWRRLSAPPAEPL